MESAGASRPAWQTEELEDEWIDQEDEDEFQATTSFQTHSVSDLSLTQPLGSVIVPNGDASTTSRDAGGTFLVREDVPAVPLHPQTPGRNKLFGKDFFSPLALEKMFEPPSPPNKSAVPPPAQITAPTNPSRLSQVYVPGQEDTEIIGEVFEDLPKHLQIRDATSPYDSEPSPLNCQFTFEVPRRPSPFNPMGQVPIAQSTPGPSRGGPNSMNPPPTDPRLRLFQFQYDTFTREHLSAMVDSIAINTPSGGSGAGNIGDEPSPTGLSPVRENNTSRLRSAKRIKLSPLSDFSDSGDGGVVIFRPPTLRKDYVGESKSLMEKIRQARDFSTVSTVASGGQSPAARDSEHPAQQKIDFAAFRRSSLAPPHAEASRAPSSSWTASSSKRGTYSSLVRERAENLMAQIRSDMKGSKRLFSGDTDLSHMAPGDKSNHSLIIHSAAEATTSDNVLEHGPSRSSSANRTSGSLRSKHRSSPRKASRRVSATNAVEADITERMSNVSLDSQQLLEQFPCPPVTLAVNAAPQATLPTNNATEPNTAFLAPPTGSGNAPTYPSSSIRSGRNEDLTRFVSSSTASGTTLTTGSAASFVKHPGPKQITHITPNDVPTLPERVGKMVFDRVMMKWVKNTALAAATPNDDDRQSQPAADGNESEDPFRDIESLREDDTGPQPPLPQVVIERADEDEPSADGDMSRLEEVDESEVEDEEEAELTSFSFDGPSGEPAQILAETEEQHEYEVTDSEDDEDLTGETESTLTTNFASDDSDDEYDDPVEEAAVEPALQDSPPHLLASHRVAPLSTPDPTSRVASGPTPTPTLRSAMKSSSITPVSAMKDPNRARNCTPANRLGHRRSVSFSDGKRDGPIIGIGRNAPTPDGSALDLEDDGGPQTAGPSSALVPSARSRRITDMLDGLEDPIFSDESPSKASSTGRPPMDELQPLKPRRPSSAAATSGNPSREVSRRVFSRTHSVKSPRSTGRKANATFLTECSFGVAHDRLVQVITDIQPFEPYWEELTTIDLSQRNVDSVVRLKEFLPRLDSLSLNNNQLSWLSGVPGTVRSLSVVANSLTSLTSYNHLLNLENLDISRNQIDSLRQLECLRHLRELRADGNRIDSIDGLQKMDGLVKLSLQNNDIRSLDLRPFRWTRLEMLNVSDNRLSKIAGLASLPALIALNLDNNGLSELDPEGPMPRLRILRISGNRLQQLNASPFPNLRTLYADNNALGTINKAYRLTKLENLSLRNQSGKPGLALSIRDIRDVKRLYLSGNPLKPGFISEPCYNLVYLELAACRLSSLPAELARLIPNVRVLNLNYNFLDDARPLEGLTRLRKLTLIGSRVKVAKQLIRVLRGMLDVEMLDFRMNPCTLGWYLPLLVRDVPGALQPSDGDRAGPGRTGGSAGFGGSSSRRAGTREEGPSRNGHKARGTSGGVVPLSATGAGAGAGGGDEGAGVSAGSPPAGSSRVAPGPAAGGTGGTTWKDLDGKFRRDLPDEAYVGRLAYRGLVMRACPAIRMLDGVEVSEKERDKAERLLKGVLGAGGRGGKEEEEEEEEGRRASGGRPSSREGRGE